MSEETKDPTGLPKGLDVVAFEVACDEEAAVPDDCIRKTEGGTVFRAWFDQIHWLIIISSICWFLCLTLISLAVVYYPPNNVLVSTSYISLVTGSLSVIGSGLLLVSGIVHHMHVKTLPPSFHLVYAQAASDVVLAVHFIISSSIALAGDTASPFTCYVLSFMGQVFGQAGSMWTAMITINLLLMLMSPIQYGRHQAEYFPLYHCIVWGTNLLVWFAAAADGGVGLSVIDTCWMLGAWALVGVGVHILTAAMILVLGVLCLYKAYHSPQMRSTLYALVKQCILLGVFYILVNSVHTTVTIMLVSTGGTPLWLTHLEAFSVPSSGFMNFMIWFGFVVRGLTMLTGDVSSSKHSSTAHGSGGNSSTLNRGSIGMKSHPTSPRASSHGNPSSGTLSRSASA